MPAELEDDGLMDDSDESDDVPSDLEDISGDEAEDVDDDAEPEDQDEQVDEDDAFSLAEGSDAEDLLPLDTDVPAGLVEWDGPDASADESEEEEWGGVSASKEKKGKRKRDEGKDARKAQRKKLRALPTFASYEDYAKLIEDRPEDNI